MKLSIKTILISCATIIYTSCEQEPIIVGIEDISFNNYPRVDGSTSTEPLNYIVAAKLLGLEYEWLQSKSGKNVIVESGYVPN